MKTTLLQKQSMGNIFLGMLISADIFLGMADIPGIFFWGGGGGVWLNSVFFFFFLVNTRCWDPVFVVDKIQSTIPPPPGADAVYVRKARLRHVITLYIM